MATFTDRDGYIVSDPHPYGACERDAHTHRDSLPSNVDTYADRYTHAGRTTVLSTIDIQR